MQSLRIITGMSGLLLVTSVLLVAQLVGGQALPLA
jgi:hypothetical protein